MKPLITHATRIGEPLRTVEDVPEEEPLQIPQPEKEPAVQPAEEPELVPARG